MAIERRNVELDQGRWLVVLWDSEADVFAFRLLKPEGDKLVHQVPIIPITPKAVSEIESLFRGCRPHDRRYMVFGKRIGLEDADRTLVVTLDGNVFGKGDTHELDYAVRQLIRCHGALEQRKYREEFWAKRQA